MSYKILNIEINSINVTTSFNDGIPMIFSFKPNVSKDEIMARMDEVDFKLSLPSEFPEAQLLPVVPELAGMVGKTDTELKS